MPSATLQVTFLSMDFLSFFMLPPISAHPALSRVSPPWPLWSWGGGRARLCTSQGEKGWQGPVLEGREGGGRHRMETQHAEHPMHPRREGVEGQARPAPQHPCPAPVPLRSHAAEKEPLCLPGSVPPQSNQVFQCVLRWACSAHGSTRTPFFCCLII